MAIVAEAKLELAFRKVKNNIKKNNKVDRSDIKDLYKAIKEYGSIESKRAKEMVKFIIDNWDDHKSYVGFSDVKKLAKEFNMEQEFQDKVITLLYNGHQMNSTHLDIAYYLSDKGLFDKHQNRIEDMIITSPDKSYFLKHYIYFLTGIKQTTISDKIYKAIIETINDWHFFRRLVNDNPPFIDPHKLLKDKLDYELKKEDNSYADYYIRLCFWNRELFSDKEMEEIADIALSHENFSDGQHEVLNSLGTIKIDPKKLQEMARKKTYFYHDYGADIANKVPGVNIEEIEDCIIKECGYSYMYNFAVKAHGAHKEKILAEMKRQYADSEYDPDSYSPSVRIVGRAEAEQAVINAERQAQQMYDILPSNEISEERILSAQVELQRAAIREAESCSGGPSPHYYIAKLEKIINDEKAQRKRDEEGREA